jgi:hypothetical protein
MSWEPEIAELRRREALARELGGKDKVQRQHKAGKLTVRERIELGPLAPGRMSIWHNHDVVRLQVSVDDAIFMPCSECRRNLPPKPQDLPDRTAPRAALQPASQRLALQKFHGDVGGAVRTIGGHHHPAAHAAANGSHGLMRGPAKNRS